MPSTWPRPSAGLRLRLAEAVSAASAPAYEIDQHNHRGAEWNLRDAVEDDIAFYVTVAPGVLAADFAFADAVRNAPRLYLALRERGLMPVLTASGQRSRRHVLCRVPSEMWSEMHQLAKSLGADVRTTIRPPLTAHRLRLPVTLLLPSDPADAAQRLGAGVAHRASEGKHPRPYPLTGTR